LASITLILLFYHRCGLIKQRAPYIPALKCRALRRFFGNDTCIIEIFQFFQRLGSFHWRRDIPVSRISGIATEHLRIKLAIKILLRHKRQNQKLYKRRYEWDISPKKEQVGNTPANLPQVELVDTKTAQKEAQEQGNYFLLHDFPQPCLEYKTIS